MENTKTTIRFPREEDNGDGDEDECGSEMTRRWNEGTIKPAGVEATTETKSRPEPAGISNQSVPSARLAMNR